MPRISKDFWRHEFACPCGCGFDTVDCELLDLLQGGRDYFGDMMIIESGCRCPAYNALPHVGGWPRSRHMVGKAADIRVKGFTPDQVADYLESLLQDWGGLGRYDTHTHVDVDEKKRRWDLRTR